MSRPTALDPRHSPRISVVVQLVSWLSKLCRHCRIHVVVVESASSSFRRCTFQPVALLNSYCGCQIRVGVVESTLVWSNPCCCCRIRLSSLNLWRCHQTRVVVVESVSSGFRYARWSFVEVGGCREQVRKIRQNDNG